jgi:hypothetical protein
MLDKWEPRPALGSEDHSLKWEHVVPDKNRTDENCHESCEVRRGWELNQAAERRLGQGTGLAGTALTKDFIPVRISGQRAGLLERTENHQRKSPGTGDFMRAVNQSP